MSTPLVNPKTPKMKNLLVILLMLSITTLFAQKKIKISADPQADIYVDGNQVSGPSVCLKIPKKGCVNVQVKQKGYETAIRNYCKSDKNIRKAEFIELRKAQRKIKISTHSNARIFINNKYITTGNTTLTLNKNNQAHIKIKRPGYITAVRNYHYNGMMQLPKQDYIELEKDKAFHSSFSTDFANREFGLYPKKGELETWRILSQVISSYFDVLEVMDLNTGYMRTAWVSKNFNSGTVRTRVILKMGNYEPLSYKIKLVSEFSDIPGVSVKEDEHFREWDRVLRVYEPLVSELQSRLKKSDQIQVNTRG